MITRDEIIPDSGLFIAFNNVNKISEIGYLETDIFVVKSIRSNNDT